MAKKKSTTVNRIGQETRVDGRISGQEDLEVHGHVVGEVAIAGTVEVTPSGIVEADVQATRLFVSGVVVGDVTATESLAIASTGRVVGALTAPTITIADGAQYAGTLDVGAPRVAVAAPVETQVETPLVELDEARRERAENTRKRVAVKKRA